uniref:Uncharacterized protein n=1 Tax=Arundo donax TaxID=35708 RepID=A0A0A9G7C6_ARUDO
MVQSVKSLSFSKLSGLFHNPILVFSTR